MVFISFSSSGLLLSYELGVAERLSQEPQLLEGAHFLGASGGALIAALLCCAPEKIELVKAYMLAGKATKGMTLSDLWDPADRLLPRFFEETKLLPPDAFEKCSGRLFISCTEYKKKGSTSQMEGLQQLAGLESTGSGGKKKRNQQFSSFNSNEELATILQASCSFDLKGIPIAVDGREGRYWDGGMSDALPLPEFVANDVLITICPFSSSVSNTAPVEDTSQHIHNITPHSHQPYVSRLQQGAAWAVATETLCDDHRRHFMPHQPFQLGASSRHNNSTRWSKGDSLVHGCGICRCRFAPKAPRHRRPLAVCCF